MVIRYEEVEKEKKMVSSLVFLSDEPYKRNVQKKKAFCIDENDEES